MDNWGFIWFQLLAMAAGCFIVGGVFVWVLIRWMTHMGWTT